MAEEPLPIKATLLPDKSMFESQQALCISLPLNVWRPSMAGQRH